MMAYNPYAYSPQTTVQWVQGEQAARSYPVAPNSSVFLMDMSGDRFYIKSSDMSGMPTFRAFTFTEIHGEARQANMPTDGQEHSYVTKEEFDALKSLVEGLKNEQSV